MMPRWKSYLKNDKGQALSEFAMVLPVLLLIVLATLTLGMMIYTKTLLVLSSSQAARTGAFIYTDETKTMAEKETAIKTVALSILNKGIAGTERKVIISVDDPPTTITVKVQYTFRYVFPLLGDIFSKSAYDLEYSSSCAIR